MLLEMASELHQLVLPWIICTLEQPVHQDSLPIVTDAIVAVFIERIPCTLSVEKRML